MRRLVVVVLLAAPLAGAVIAPSACTLQRSATFATASALPSVPRRPDGVAVDLQGTPPPTVARGKTSSGWVTLLEPADASGAVSAVRAFFEAVSREDGAGLREVLTRDALWFAPSGNPTGAGAGSPAEQVWDRRFGKFDYRATGPEPVYRETSMELYAPRDLQDVEGERPARPVMMEEQDLLVRVPIEVRKVGQDRVFGDEILFLVRRTAEGFRVRVVIEDFQAY
ncbi:MAG TPA: hypothetical protein PLI95_04760 [Polyangiaceae bacterium]|nr:hypothetical protein [Polyangiaceae bacterium]